MLPVTTLIIGHNNTKDAVQCILLLYYKPSVWTLTSCISIASSLPSLSSRHSNDSQTTLTRKNFELLNTIDQEETETANYNSFDDDSYDSDG